VRASLADQGGCTAGALLAIALGANLPSAAGEPLETLMAVRPQLHQLLQAWAGEPCAPQWSPLFRSEPVGGPPDQPDYFNAVLVVPLELQPSLTRAEQLLQRLQQLELAFGRERLEHWGPRSLDLDLLWWGQLRSCSPQLELPHPRWQDRGFVLEPLRAIASGGVAVSALPGLAQLLPPVPQGQGQGLQRLPGQLGWPE
jgi:2-amino-4-hydroxy-6-hydroxymethyldihydropteridine diphosphokinase